MDLTNYGVQELNAKEKISVDGGGWLNSGTVFGHLFRVVTAAHSFAHGLIEGLIEGGEKVIEANQ